MKTTDLRHILTEVPDAVEEEYFDLQNFHCNKKHEYNQIKELIRDLIKANMNIDLSNFYVGFQIDQIGKEFDLLRFGKNFDINIEIKGSIPPKSKKNKQPCPEKIVNQLERDKYYLQAHQKSIWSFSFIADDNSIYETDGNTLIESNFEKLSNLITSQELDDINLSEIFSPKQYLISPFNTPERFLRNEYFLTTEQEEKKKQILTSDEKYFTIQGGPGTGKTLLIYDLAKEYQNREKNVVIIHSGELNDGQRFLNQNGFKIVGGYESPMWKDAEVLIIDEAQRFYSTQFRVVKNINFEKLIICGDDNQILSLKNETDTLISKKSNDSFISIILNSKIRTNKEIGKFIKGLFDLSKMDKFINNGNIQIRYFSSQKEAQSYADYISKKSFNIIDYDVPYEEKEGKKVIIQTALKARNELTTKHVIGQEFDDVAVGIGPGFKYINGLLEFNYDDVTYYSGRKMLFQAVTRARQKLTLIVFENDDFLTDLLGTLK